MIVVDTELSGLEPTKHSLVSIGAYDFENPSNFFYEECRVWDGAHIMDEALAVNGFSRQQILDKNKPRDEEVVARFLAWAEKIEERTIAGQNPSTDRDFIKATCERYHLNWPLAHRVIDLHSICYFHMLERGGKPPTKNHHSGLDLDAILEYVGLSPEPKPHNALIGAKLETEALWRIIKGKSAFPEYTKISIPFIANKKT